MPPTNKELDKLLVQLRRIEEHRTAEAEKAVRKLYKELLKDLQNFISTEYANLAEDDKLTYAILQSKGDYARFLEQVQASVDGLSPRVQRAITSAVEETYSLAYNGMLDAVNRSASSAELKRNLAGIRTVQPEVIRSIVNNPIYGLTLNDRLEKHRKDVIYNIKQQIGIGLTQGDRYSTMARRISEQLDMDYKKSMRIVRTETHRVREAGEQDSAAEIDKALQNGQSGMRMVKVWRTMQDQRVRPNKVYKTKKGVKIVHGHGPDHQKMEGQTVLVDEPFDLGGGVTAMSPGQSGVAGHDCNCRCKSIKKLMTDEEYFKATGKHFPGATQNVENPVAEGQETDYNIAERTSKLRNSGMSNEDYNDYVQTLENHSNESVKRVYARYADGINDVKYTSGSGFYRPSTNSLEFSYPNERYIKNGQSKYTTLAHEYGHYFDCKAQYSGLTYNEVKALNGALGSERFGQKASSSDKFLSAVRADKKELKSIGFTTLAKELRGKAASAGVQDAIDGMFAGSSYRIGWGHGESYYNRIYSSLQSADKMLGTSNCKKIKKAYKDLGLDASNQSKVANLCRDYETASEMWANIMSAEVCGGEELEYIKKYLPNSYKALIEILKGVVIDG